MTPEARQRARALAHRHAGCYSGPGQRLDGHGDLCDELTATLTPYLEALEVAREALGNLRSFVVRYEGGELYWEGWDYTDSEHVARLVRAALARIAALTPEPH